MTDIAASAELATQIFDLGAVAYRAEPSDANFAVLCEKLPEPGDSARLSELLYDVARGQAFAVPTIAHLAKALAIEHRLHEAAHYCSLWVDKDPASEDGHRLSVLIACQCIDLPRARASFAQLKTMSAAVGTLWALETAMLLAFSDGKSAEITARHALTSAPQDAMAPLIAADAAYRNDDGRLLIHAIEADPALSAVPGREARSKQMLRSLLLAILKARSTDA